MGMKKRNKVSAEFSMSSLTDIIFLLLIFFMLTSSLVQINVPLPKSDSKTIAPTDFTVMMTKDGKTTYNGKTAKVSEIKSKIQDDYKSMNNKKNATVAIVAEVGVPWSKVNDIIEISNALKMRAIIATEPRK